LNLKYDSGKKNIIIGGKQIQLSETNEAEKAQKQFGN
jgi:hypothetical protein